MSEYQEDQWIEEHLTLPAKGFYVDVGCATPSTDDSNTRFLRARGWDGIGIDANANYAEHWQTPFVAAIVSSQAVVPFEYRRIPTHSRVTGNVLFAATTLDRILRFFDAPTVDFLSLDVEGHEFEALQSLDMDRYRPKVIISEYSTEGIGDDFRVRDYLLARGYAVVHQTKANLIYALH